MVRFIFPAYDTYTNQRGIDTTARNTTKNMGTIEDGGAHKESMMDKVKDKLGMGHHEKK